MSRASGQVSFCDAPNMSRCRSSPTLSTSTRCPGPSGEKVLSTRVGRAGWMARRPIAVVLFFPSSRRIVFATPSVPSGFGFWLRSETYVRALPAYQASSTPPPAAPAKPRLSSAAGGEGGPPDLVTDHHAPVARFLALLCLERASGPTERSHLTFAEVCIAAEELLLSIEQLISAPSAAQLRASAADFEGRVQEYLLRSCLAPERSSASTVSLAIAVVQGHLMLGGSLRTVPEVVAAEVRALVGKAREQLTVELRTLSRQQP